MTSYPACILWHHTFRTAAYSRCEIQREHAVEWPVVLNPWSTDLLTSGVCRPVTHTHIHTADKFFTFDLCCASICTYFSTLPFCFLNVNVMQRSVACFVLRPRSKCDSELQLWGQCLRHCLHQYLHRLVNSKLVGAGDGTPKQPHFQESAAAAASTVKTRSIMFSRISSDVIFTAPRCRSVSFLSRLETDTDTDTWFSLFFCFLVDFQ